MQVQVPRPAAIGQCRLNFHRRFPGPPSPRQGVPGDRTLALFEAPSLTLQVHGTMAKILAFFVIAVSRLIRDVDKS